MTPPSLSGRRFTVACWQDLQHVPNRAAETVKQAEEKLREAAKAREEQRWADATALIATARALLNSTDESVSAAGERLRRLRELAGQTQEELAFEAGLTPTAVSDLLTAERFVRPLAQRFEVSAESMRIRLEELELLESRPVVNVE